MRELRLVPAAGSAKGAFLVPTSVTDEKLHEQGRERGLTAAQLAKLDLVPGSRPDRLRRAREAGVPIGSGSELPGHRQGRAVPQAPDISRAGHTSARLGYLLHEPVTTSMASATRQACTPARPPPRSTTTTTSGPAFSPRLWPSALPATPASASRTRVASLLNPATGARKDLARTPDTRAGIPPHSSPPLSQLDKPATQRNVCQ
jgi:hypothetical protein